MFEIIPGLHTPPWTYLISVLTQMYKYICNIFWHLKSNFFLFFKNSRLFLIKNIFFPHELQHQLVWLQTVLLLFFVLNLWCWDFLCKNMNCLFTYLHLFSSASQGNEKISFIYKNKDFYLTDCLWNSIPVFICIMYFCVYLHLFLDFSFSAVVSKIFFTIISSS